MSLKIFKVIWKKMGLCIECFFVGEIVVFVVLFYCDDSFCWVRWNVWNLFMLEIMSC